ncbi:autolytic lysozyme [Clostridium saccharobutylicum]|uniref:GH25 family lysozyme n=1 Tax=Clostridium saccharobutylicum TaxID=169679 RepID=UPI0009839580|nr:GH25 family lysozyme [Clostridium saccharobutylicum]AQS10552.1 autolytic lysozyme [Clostridium saccharobutylicum]MBC2438091.1 glycoside hydrolase [Clostridium saccharobutylicum]NSB90451.1 GH25 family lysozyme M1 (1,4-beta-N-acetylmuramidase) [Clostridium saccharobutylicum]NYC31506.1 GH25 family lysozyme M1 (1,4-beta-N-acetylmuramidase) [Clostridium saccharobutylicum]OOM18825.1 autolytic lysozyme [Clostridium saccharobutylicum]
MKGIDISNNDGNVDFTKVVADGVQVAYIKATEGTTYADGYLETYYSKAKQEGLKVGFYHFLVGTSQPETQAYNFYNHIKDKTSDLIPMLDVETAFNGLMDYALRFIAKFKELSNLPIGMYTYTSFLDNLDNRLGDYPLWEANYNNNPWNLPSNLFNSRIGHQYTETGLVDGVSTKCDVNEFNDGVFVSTWKLGWNQNSTGYWYCTDVTNKYYYKDSWQQIDGEWYSFDSDGYARKSTWLQDGGYWYYLQDSCIMARNKWLWIDGECYYFGDKGGMYVNCTTPDGYKVDEIGAWIQ